MKDIILWATNKLSNLNYTFIEKPLFVGGIALEYHDVRKNGTDIDIMVSPEDWVNLKKMFPDNINLFGGKTESDVDATINTFVDNTKLDLISTLFMYKYHELIDDSIELEEYKVISLRNVLFLKTLAAVETIDQKSIRDQQLIVNKICDIRYPKNL
tara:strand:- start:539 stop:1006 length:468 start_codon:yes stop_codon:yes gene_type:complete